MTRFAVSDQAAMIETHTHAHPCTRTCTNKHTLVAEK